MNILHKMAFTKDIIFIQHVYDDDYTLIYKGYKFNIDEDDVDYPSIDKDIYINIMKDIDNLYNLRTS